MSGRGNCWAGWRRQRQAKATQIDVVERITQLLAGFNLNTAAPELCPSLEDAAIATRSCSGVQEALWRLSGVVEVLRSDTLSAATHELPVSGGRALTRRCQSLLDHYGLKSTRIFPRKAHESSGDIFCVKSHERQSSRSLSQFLQSSRARSFLPKRGAGQRINTLREKSDCQNRSRPGTPGPVGAKPAYELGGSRCKGGMSSIQASVGNVRTLLRMKREMTNGRHHEEEYRHRSKGRSCP
jgi:hypothetical protein